jgi:hypothetical protein
MDDRSKCRANIIMACNARSLFCEIDMAWHNSMLLMLLLESLVWSKKLLHKTSTT